MATEEAWVTLATNDAYALGCLVLGQSLKRVGTTRKLHCLITEGVSQGMRENLWSVFDDVSVVNVLDSGDEENLTLIGRPDLGVTFTKLHCWRLLQYRKCVFMDADTLVLQNADDLFERDEISAAPDIGWPDIFNSGVFVYSPSLDTYRALLQHAVTVGSFDGGDQGLLNSYFSDWRTKDARFRLPFTYNMTSSAVYTYAAAYQKFAKEIRIVHFLGETKPWHATGLAHGAGGHHQSHLTQWWAIFRADVQPRLSKEMSLPYVARCCEEKKCASSYLPPLPISPCKKKEDKEVVFNTDVVEYEITWKSEGMSESEEWRVPQWETLSQTLPVVKPRPKHTQTPPPEPKEIGPVNLPPEPEASGLLPVKVVSLEKKQASEQSSRTSGKLPAPEQLGPSLGAPGGGGPIKRMEARADLHKVRVTKLKSEPKIPSPVRYGWMSSGDEYPMGGKNPSQKKEKKGRGEGGKDKEWKETNGVPAQGKDKLEACGVKVTDIPTTSSSDGGDRANKDRLLASGGAEAVVTPEDDYAHQRAWEAGHVDYLGRDSWENIQKRLDKTLQSGGKAQAQ